MALGEFMGAFIFSMTIVLYGVIGPHKWGFKLTTNLVIKDMIYYSCILILFLLFSWIGFLPKYSWILLFFIYISYVFVSLYMDYRENLLFQI